MGQMPEAPGRTKPDPAQASFLTFLVFTAGHHGADAVIIVTQIDIWGIAFFSSVKIEILVGGRIAAFAISSNQWLGLFERRRLLRLEHGFWSPSITTGDAGNGLVLREVVKPRVALRAGTLGAPFSLDHNFLREPGLQSSTPESRAHCHTQPRLSKRRPMNDRSSPVSLSLLAPGPLTGITGVPGDKSISHRALMLGALAVGETIIDGLLEGEDVLATAAAMRAMGAGIERRDSRWHVHGVGVGGLLQPQVALDMGNSGTSTRLLMGLVASHAIVATFIGDASLSRRPMGRVIEPLSLFGARFAASPSGRLPLTMKGLCPAVPLTYTLPVASAQVKSAVLLAGLNTPGETTVIEPIATRDHSERMLAGFGATLRIEIGAQGRIITLVGEAELKPQAITVPGDPSSAAFPIVAALIVPGSEVTITNVGINSTRAGLIGVLQAMGADISVVQQRIVGGEPVADLIVRHSLLNGIDVPPEVAPSMIDEFPILFVAAAFAQGRTIMRGIEELRVKESDRIAVMARGLAACGVTVEETLDGMIVSGSGGDPVPGGAMIAAELDHRIAMSFAVLGLNARQPVTIDDARPIATSFPGFIAMMQSLGTETLNQ